MLDTRAMISLSQYLALQDKASLRVLFEKHNMSTEFEELLEWHGDVFTAIRATLSEAPSDRIHSLLGEIVRTEDYFRSLANKGWEDVGYRGRWEDLIYCLELIGYRIEDRRLVTVDPTIEGSIPLDDDLSTELKRSGLPGAHGILQKINDSANSFRATPPDYNACLTDARVALETLTKTIAKKRLVSIPASFQEDKFGQVLTYLRASGLITQKDEEGISGVYSFVSPGAHILLGFTEQEMARLGRSLVASMCYFLIKRFNSSA